VADIFSPIKTRRAFEEISSEVKRLIFKGTLKPGDRLPSETELAGQFNVGRQTIREALRLLELSGFISIHKGGSGGAVVVDTILNTISKSFFDAFKMRRITIDEMITARFEIEQVVLRSFFRHSDAEDMKALRQNVSSARKKLEQKLQAFDDNIQFHRLLAVGSKNYFFLVVMESIIAVISDFRTLLSMDYPVSTRSAEDHEAILDAVSAGDEGKALEILRQHLQYVDGRFKEFVLRLQGGEEHYSWTESEPSQG
jgi:DNA-binding FadR family transcriptional regulator